ncbi:hypothetical protein K439DRAFT_852840 [Ramaria rubella]|nr:hypothetical protein K439DRAFT_852840 [Ramaria rubella]
MSYWPSTNNGHHPHMSSINHPIYTQPATTAPQSTYSTQMHAQPSYMPSTDAFYIREINKALASQIGSHFDKGFNTLQDTLLQRISSQDNILSKQQQILESLSCLVTSRHDDSIKEQETLRIELLELKEKSDSQTRSTGLAMKQLAGETIKNIRDSRCAIELKLLCVEESLESLVEEIRDPQANMNELVHHEVAVGPSSPVATPSYRDVGVTPDIIASQPLPIPASPFRASEPIHLPENPSNCGGWDTQHNDNVHSVYENSEPLKAEMGGLITW